MTILFNTRPISHSKSADYLRGASAIMNLRGNTKREYNMASSPEEADESAIQNDWNAISVDLQCSLDTYGRDVR